MATSISITDTISQVVTDVVEMPAATLLQERYFGSGEMDIFDSRSLLIDYDNGDRKAGAFLKQGYANGDTTTFFSQTVVPPRIGVSDNIDTVSNDKDRMMFEQLSKMQKNGIRPTRADVFNALLRLKAARCGDRVMRSIERLCVMALKENAVQFQYDTSPTDSTAVTCDVQFYDPSLAANPQCITPTVAWGQSGATPYDDVCAAILAVKQHGGRAEDLLLSDDAWELLRADMVAKGLWDNQIHYTVIANGKDRDGLFPEIMDYVEVIGDISFNGHRLKVIVYSHGYEAADGTFNSFLGNGFACVLAPNCGHTLFGAVSKVNPKAIVDYNVDAVACLTGKLIGTRHVSTETDDVSVRVESVPLPIPRRIWGWCSIDCLKAW